MGTSKFALYAAETSKRTFVGDLLKYNKGVWEPATKLRSRPDGFSSPS